MTVTNSLHVLIISHVIDTYIAGPGIHGRELEVWHQRYERQWFIPLQPLGCATQAPRRRIGRLARMRSTTGK